MLLRFPFSLAISVFSFMGPFSVEVPAFLRSDVNPKFLPIWLLCTFIWTETFIIPRHINIAPDRGFYCYCHPRILHFSFFIRNQESSTGVYEFVTLPMYVQWNLDWIHSSRTLQNICMRNTFLFEALWNSNRLPRGFELRYMPLILAGKVCLDI